MKTPNSKLSAVMILPAAVLLSQCAPTDRIPPPTVISIPVSTSDWSQESSLRSIFDPPGLPGIGKPAASNGNESPWIAAVDRALDLPGAPPAVMLEPLIVTDNLSSVLIDGMRYWPGDIRDAEEKKAWISFKPQDRPSRYPTGDSVDAWKKSLR